MAFLINSTAQFYTDGLEIAKTSLSQVYLDAQWITPRGQGSMVEVRFFKFKSTEMTTSIETNIDGIPDRGFEIDATPAIIEGGGLMGLDMSVLHDLVITKLELDYPGFDGKITKYDPFNP